jgi:hypothetical protein
VADPLSDHAVRRWLTSSSRTRPYQKTPPTFVSWTLALALSSPFVFANLSALALSPGALRLRLRSVRVFAPALVPHASEEQDLSCAAVGRSHTTGTVRGPERDDIVHCGPLENRLIVVVAPSVEGRRLTNGQKAGGPVYVNGLRGPALQIRCTARKYAIDYFNIPSASPPLRHPTR